MGFKPRYQSGPGNGSGSRVSGGTREKAWCAVEPRSVEPGPGKDISFPCDCLKARFRFLCQKPLAFIVSASANAVGIWAYIYGCRWLWSSCKIVFRNVSPGFSQTNRGRLRAPSFPFLRILSLALAWGAEERLTAPASGSFIAANQLISILLHT